VICLCHVLYRNTPNRVTTRCGPGIGDVSWKIWKIERRKHRVVTWWGPVCIIKRKVVPTGKLQFKERFLVGCFGGPCSECMLRSVQGGRSKVVGFQSRYAGVGKDGYGHRQASTRASGIGRREAVLRQFKKKQKARLTAHAVAQKPNARNGRPSNRRRPVPVATGLASPKRRERSIPSRRKPSGTLRSSAETVAALKSGRAGRPMS